MTNPFEPPAARVDDLTIDRGSPFKAIIVALIVDFGGTTIAGILLTMAYGAALALSGATPDQVMASLKDIPVDSWPSVTGIAIGTLLSALGGYVCARIAKHSEYRLGWILAAISTALGMAIGGTTYSALLNIAMAIVGVVAIMFGVRLGVARNGAK